MFLYKLVFIAVYSKSKVVVTSFPSKLMNIVSLGNWSPDYPCLSEVVARFEVCACVWMLIMTASLTIVIFWPSWCIIAVQISSSLTAEGLKKNTFEDPNVLKELKQGLAIDYFWNYNDGIDNETFLIHLFASLSTLIRNFLYKNDRFGNIFKENKVSKRPHLKN